MLVAQASRCENLLDILRHVIAYLVFDDLLLQLAQCIGKRAHEPLRAGSNQ